MVVRERERWLLEGRGRDGCYREVRGEMDVREREGGEMVV